MKLEDYTIAICLVPHGYQIDLLDHKSYLDGKVKSVHSECRDYGDNIDVEEISEKIINLIRKGEDV